MHPEAVQAGELWVAMVGVYLHAISTVSLQLGAHYWFH